MYLLSRQSFRLQLVEQPPHPAIGDGGGGQAGWLAALAKLAGELGPAFVIADQAMRRFHQHRPQLRVAGFDEARIGLLLATGSISRAKDRKTEPVACRCGSGRTCQFQRGG